MVTKKNPKIHKKKTLKLKNVQIVKKSKNLEESRKKSKNHLFFSPVHPVSESRGGSVSLKNLKSLKNKGQRTEILVSYFGFHEAPKLDMRFTIFVNVYPGSYYNKLSEIM